MDNNKKILLSGVKPTGRPHIGNYFGAMKQFVELQDEYKSYIFIANYHALTTVNDKKKLEENSMDIALDYLAIGLDPQKTTLFFQSDVPEVTELAWIFNCITTMPFLMRAHAFKDAEAKSKEVNVGLFDYPLLMAADILIQNADVVPVGQDQKQHVEIARDSAEKFNRVFGDTFKLPEPKILGGAEVVPGIDGKKMSKSYKNTIPLFAEDDEVKKIVMSIVTDSKTPKEPKDSEKCNIFALHKLFSTNILDELRERYEKGGIGYKESKEILADNIIKFITPLREKRKELEKNKDEVLAVLKNGGDIARGNARAKMQEIKERVGLI